MTHSLKSSDNQNAGALWSPKGKEDSVIERFMALVNERTGEDFSDYKALHQWSIDQNEEFWSMLWDFAGVIGDKGAAVTGAQPHVPWVRFFPDSKISYTENMLARVKDTPDAPAIIARRQGDEDEIITWQGLCDRVSLWEQALKGAGIAEGDHVGAYLPNVPESVIVFLASANLGAVFSSIGTEMGQADLIKRLTSVKPKIFIAADGYVHGAKSISRSDVVAQAQKEIEGVEQTILIGLINEEPALDGLENTMSAQEFLKPYAPQKLEFVRRDFNHPLYILFSSGTSGNPKCFEHSSGGILLKHMSEYLLSADVKPGDRMFYHASPSWMMWNWLASGLGAGATILMYDGSPAYPDAYAQWNFTADNKCTHHGTAAPVILSWSDANLDIAGHCDLSDLRMVLSTGAVLPDQGFTYIHDHIKRDVKVASISGGTDIVGCFVGGNALTPTYAGEINGPMMGMDVHSWNVNGADAPVGEEGELVCVNAFPSMPLRFLNDPGGKAYKKEYFETYEGQKVWHHGDCLANTAHGQMRILRRSDTTLNPNGVRIGPEMIYNQLLPFKDQIKGAVAIDFIRPDNSQAATILFLAMEDYKAGVHEDLTKAIKNAIKVNVTPYAIPSEIIAVPDVLKTPNGKVSEIVTNKIVNGKVISNPSLYGENLVKFYEEIGRMLQDKYAPKTPYPENGDGPV